MKTIISKPELCSGCRACEMACSVVHEQQFGSSVSRIRVVKMEHEGLDVPVTCHQCTEPPCMEVCPVDAITRNGKTNAILIDEEECIGCGRCVEACWAGAINFHPDKNMPFVCDLCNGNPQCVDRCPLGALVYEDRNGLAQKKREELALYKGGVVWDKWNKKKEDI